MPVKQTPVQAEIVDVTPKLASRWLDANHGNRNVRQRIVTAYARDMTAGRWKLSGEGVKFSATDRLVDGQHRLHAVVQSGITVPMLVVRGLDDEVQDVLDSGAGRTAGDALRMRAEPHYSLLAAGARIALQFQDGRLDQGGACKYTHSELMDWIDKHPEMRTAVEATSRLAKQVALPPSVLTLSIWRLSQVDSEACMEFFQRLAFKTHLEPGSPVLALLYRLTDIERTARRTNRSTYVSLVFRAWNYYRQGKSVGSIQITSKGQEIETPQPR